MGGGGSLGVGVVPTISSQLRSATTSHSLKPEDQIVLREFMKVSGGLHFIKEEQLLDLCRRLKIHYNAKKFRRLVQRLDPTQSNLIELDSVLQWIAKRNRKKRLNRI